LNSIRYYLCAANFAVWSMSETGEPAPAPSGPSRATGRVSRPPTTFVTTPIKVNPVAQVSLPVYQEAEGSSDEVENVTPEQTSEPTPEPPTPAPAAGGLAGGPSRTKQSGLQRPGTSFVGAFAAPVNPSLDRHLNRQIPANSPGSPYPQPANPAREREAELIEQDKKAATQYEKLTISPNELLSLASTEEIWDRSEFVRTCRTKMNNLHIIQQLYVALANPTQSK
jgi:hypothetical protein